MFGEVEVEVEVEVKVSPLEKLRKRFAALDNPRVERATK
jgi:hypothetical protein